MFWAASDASTTRLRHLFPCLIFLFTIGGAKLEALNGIVVEKLTPLGSELKRLMAAEDSEIQTVPHLAQALEIPEFDAWGLFDGSTEVDDAMAKNLATAFGTTPGYWLAQSWRMWANQCNPIVGSQSSPAETLNKKLIAVLASLLEDCFENRSQKIRALASYPSSESAVELLAEIGVLIETADGEYEFAPGFDPATGGWQ
jgi:plasmid maintenance system antidote protein VapI